MKIGYLTQYFYPIVGGAENNCFYLARELAKKHEVHVFTSNIKDSGQLEKEEIIDNIYIHRCKPLFKYKYYFIFCPSLLPKVLKQDLDILHIHSLGFLYSDITAFLKKFLSKTKIVNTPHGPFMTLQNYPLWQKSLRAIIRFIEKPLNKYYDSSIEVNPAQSKWMVKAGFSANKINFVPNGVRKEYFKKVATKEFINNYNLNNKFVVSYLGRIQKYKGLEQVISIMPEIIKHYPNFVFLVMGEGGGDLGKLKLLCKKLKIGNNVVFTGKVSENDKLKGLKVSKIFILPSEWEAFGIVILEAMAQGNAIITTQTEGGEFLIKQKENGFLYKYGDVKGLKEKLLTLLKNKKLMDKMKANNYKKAKTFTWDKVAFKLEKIYKKVLENSN